MSPPYSYFIASGNGIGLRTAVGDNLYEAKLQYRDHVISPQNLCIQVFERRIIRMISRG